MLYLPWFSLQSVALKYLMFSDGSILLPMKAMRKPPWVPGSKDYLFHKRVTTENLEHIMPC